MNRARKFAIQRCASAVKDDAQMPMIYKNADMSARHLSKFCQLDDEASVMLRSAYDKMGLSARGYDRLLRVARTIADLAECESIGKQHIAEAIQLRTLDRKYFG